MSSQSPRFLISVDYGTTYTGVAWVLTTAAPPRLADVKVVRQWAGGIGPKVPSVFTYSASSGEQWGFRLGDGSYVLRWTKLELEPPSRLKALKSLRSTLAETRLLDFDANNLVDQIPRHLIRTAEDIVTDYLTEVAIWVRQDIQNEKDPETLRDFPIDLIITHPATWHSRARNTTFRAVNEAFRRIFPEMEEKPGNLRLTTESEACAQYTMKVAQDQGMAGLRKGECFIVVDAGGGTVDLVSYRVDQLTPNFIVTKVTEVSGGNFGATRVDEHFLKRFLPTRLSPNDYDTLMNIGGIAERHGNGSHVVFTKGEQIMLERFQIIKHKFAGRPQPGEQAEPDYIDLPENIGLEDDPQRGISQGRLRITYAELEQMFRESVEGTRRLISEQLTQIELLRLRVRTIFLSGGFSRNQHLFKEILELTRKWRFTLLRGDESDEGSWTAVIKGAALLGLGVGCEIPPRCIQCPYHIGVVVSATRFIEHDYDESQLYTDTFDHKKRLKSQAKWVIAKGDLITQHEGLEKRVKFVKKMTRAGNQAGSVDIVISNYTGPTDMMPEASRQEFSLDYDLSMIPPRDRPTMFRSSTNQSGMSYHTVDLELEIRLDQERAYFTLVCGRTIDLLGNVGAPGFILTNRIMDFTTGQGS
ncbi:hypothetical protein B0T22DRAFT_405788 [Podospora appendiculata]|uniref:Uncharacterized protein n=1 Tax=Podospora appendiculata TaxID=314037 RepID=A0AAE0X8I1_9PEZI|nr:hypothetical protein B0T22DRAFT_405788 [Podospora appendiculata]